ELRQRVAAQQEPDDAGAPFAAQLAQGVDRVARSGPAQLDVQDSETGVARGGAPGHLESVGGRGEVGSRFESRYGGGDEVDGLEIEFFRSRFGKPQVRDVYRVECAPQEAYSTSAAQNALKTPRPLVRPQPEASAWYLSAAKTVCSTCAQRVIDLNPRSA